MDALLAQDKLNYSWKANLPSRCQQILNHFFRSGELETKALAHLASTFLDHFANG
jgi:hypothetical protein